MHQDRLTPIDPELVASHNTREEMLGEKGRLKAIIDRMLEDALHGEIPQHLGYEKHPRAKNAKACNGFNHKQLQTDRRTISLQVSRAWQAGFAPQVVKKQPTRLDGFGC